MEWNNSTAQYFNLKVLRTYNYIFKFIELKLAEPIRTADLYIDICIYLNNC
jgi:hypothetical protein